LKFYWSEGGHDKNYAYVRVDLVPRKTGVRVDSGWRPGIDGGVVVVGWLHLEVLRSWALDQQPLAVYVSAGLVNAQLYFFLRGLR
jgi:hypothetical protein